MCPKEKLKCDFAVNVYYLYIQNILLIYPKNVEISKNEIQKEWFTLICPFSSEMQCRHHFVKMVSPERLKG